jgi:hypothetical protein
MDIGWFLESVSLVSETGREHQLIVVDSEGYKIRTPIFF